MDKKLYQTLVEQFVIYDQEDLKILSLLELYLSL